MCASVFWILVKYIYSFVFTCVYLSVCMNVYLPYHFHEAFSAIGSNLQLISITFTSLSLIRKTSSWKKWKASSFIRFYLFDCSLNQITNQSNLIEKMFLVIGLILKSAFAEVSRKSTDDRIKFWLALAKRHMMKKIGKT